MITGHVGIAFAARARWRDAPLTWLLAASVAPDAIDYAWAGLGVCNPTGAYSHSLPAILVLGVALAAVVLLVTRNRGNALLVAGMVLVHDAADLVTGYKSFFLPSGPLIGLDLYKWPMLDFAVETVLVVAGWSMLRRTQRAPAWARSVVAVAALLVTQATAEVIGYRYKKPTACADLVVPGRLR